jgi:hypothetical protein
MKIILFVLLSLTLSACGQWKDMSNEEIYKAVEECKSYGFEAREYINGLTYATWRVKCVIPNKEIGK